jgi:hypothetical protein
LGKKLICSSNEAKRTGAVMDHVQFKADPWATIRMHAGNSLVVKVAPKSAKAKAKAAKGVPQAAGRFAGMDFD